jgi:hypothetical protein
MALVLSVWDGSSWNVFDQTANGFCLPVVKHSYSHPAELTFRLHVPQHTRPIADRARVKLEDDATLVFQGHVFEINPKETLEVEYTCYGPDMRARQEITILSTDHTDISAIPRLVYNAKIDNDDDYAFEAEHDADVGDILEDLFTNAVTELRDRHAAPLASTAFEASDLTPLDFIPQEKVVFETEKLGQGIDRLLNYYPAYRLLFNHTTQKWRVVNVRSASQQTLTLNDFSGTFKVLSMSLRRSMEQRATAFKIYGPQEWKITTVYSSGTFSGGLTENWNIAEKINFEAGGPGSPGVGDCSRKWTITDTDRNQISRLFPEDVYLSDSQFNVDGTSLQFRAVRQPTLQATWDADGNKWWTIPGIKINIRDGIIETPVPVYQFRGMDATPKYALPGSVRLIYAYFGEPVNVRKPAVGYEGTAYTVAGMEYEERIYDEMLAVGYEKGTPVLLATRTAQYEKLAQAYLDAKKDIVYTGGCVLEGLQYDFLNLAKQINVAAVDGNGSTVTTGWEAINAVLTDVEFDYQEKVTTLTFNSDLMDFTETDVEALKRALKIKALETVGVSINDLFVSGGQLTNFYSYIRYLIDPETREVEGSY